MKKQTVKMVDVKASSLRARLAMILSLIFKGQISFPLDGFIEYLKSQHIGDFTKAPKKSKKKGK